MNIHIKYPTIEFNSSSNGPSIFLAGPVSGNEYWRQELIEELQKNTEIDELTIYSPQYKNKTDKFIGKSLQATWETKALNYCYKHGFIVFFLANQIDDTFGRGYARTTRFELGEWVTKYRFGNDKKTHLLIVGIESDFEGKDYLIHRLTKNYNITSFPSNIRELSTQIIKNIKLI